MLYLSFSWVFIGSEVCIPRLCQEEFLEDKVWQTGEEVDFYRGFYAFCSLSPHCIKSITTTSLHLKIGWGNFLSRNLVNNFFIKSLWPNI